MSSPILHIKDAYYFEVPRVLWKSDRKTIDDFPEHYVRLDPDYQDWEAQRQYDGLAKIEPACRTFPPKASLLERVPPLAARARELRQAVRSLP